MHKTPTHRPCVAVVILRRGKSGRTNVLIVHKSRKHDAWQVPQGGIESGETAEEAAMRELQEETGITLKEAPRRHEAVYQYDYPAGFIRREKPKYAGQNLVFVIARVSRRTRVTVDQRELNGFRWIAPEEIGKYLKRDEYRKIVDQVIADAGKLA